MSRLLGKAINPLVGLASEAIQHNKDKKAQERRQSSPQPDNSNSSSPQQSPPGDLPPAYAEIATSPRSRSPSPGVSDTGSNSGDETDNDEDDWAREAIQDELANPPNEKPVTNVSKLIGDFFARHPDHLRGAPYAPLPCPVIIPQRRPNAKNRGFVRAYAPVLQDSGIEQSLFSDFLEGFGQAIRGQGAFTAFNGAVAISVMAETVAAGSVDPIIHFAALAVHLSVEAGRRVYESVKTNNYLTEMNERLFKPHGLYAMIMTYKPGSNQISQIADMNTNTISAVAAREGGRSKVRTSAGKATDDQIPECAPLIFPALENANDEEKANAFKRSMAFIGEYQDKRAQATWQQKNPNSKLNVPGSAPEFSSSSGDPRHTAYQGGVINLLSGGRSGGLKQERRAYKSQRREERGQLRAARRGVESTGSKRQQRDVLRRYEMGVSSDDTRTTRQIRRDYRQKRKDQGLTPISFVKRQLGEGIIYLIIVNMPTEAEMAEAAALTKKSGIFD